MQPDPLSTLRAELLDLLSDPERLRGRLDQDDRTAIGARWRATYREAAAAGRERPEYLTLAIAIEDTLLRFLAAVRAHAEATGDVELERALDEFGAT